MSQRHCAQQPVSERRELGALVQVAARPGTRPGRVSSLPPGLPSFPSANELAAALRVAGPRPMLAWLSPQGAGRTAM